jgi:tail-anchored protein insertion receptor
MSPLEAVLILQVVVTLINLVGVNTINDTVRSPPALITSHTNTGQLWALYNKLPFAKSSSAEKEGAQMRKELLRANNELRSTSAQDDFAKWARLRRKVDKMQDEYKIFSAFRCLRLLRRWLISILAKTNRDFKSSFVFYINGARMLVTYGFQFYIQIRFSRHAIFWLPKGWLPWFGEWVVSFPAAPRGAVSLQAWQLACRAVIGMIADAILATVALLRGQLGTGSGAETVPEPTAQST